MTKYLITVQFASVDLMCLFRDLYVMDVPVRKNVAPSVPYFFVLFYIKKAATFAEYRFDFFRAISLLFVS